MADAGAVTTIVGKVYDTLFVEAKTSISYMWNCSKNVQTCKDELKRLSDVEETLQNRIKDAETKAEVPGKDMESWIEEAGKKISEAQTFIDEEAKSKKTYCNLYRNGKKAIEIKSSLLEQQKRGHGFRDYKFFPLPSPRKIDCYQRKNFENIDTQKSTFNEIVRAIKNEDIQIIGITGQGGTGITTLAYEVAAEMKNEFNHIEILDVSVDKKQDDQKKVEIAAKKVMNKEKVLIILDAVWEVLKLDDMGFPRLGGYKNFKILITSRKEDVCRVMAHETFTVMPLQVEEAWTLFKRAVNVIQWDKKLEDVGLEIVQKCGGLPLFVQVLGNTVKGQDLRFWETVRDQLQAPMVFGNDNFKNEFIILKPSYDNLQNEVAKKCFLLCSMFPEDETIGLKRLTHYGLALEIIKNVDNIQQAISKVRFAVESLIRSSLLQPVARFHLYKVSREGEEEEFKMHALVREMALSITSEGNDSWVRSGKRLGHWKPNDCGSYKKISLIGNSIKELPDHGLQFSHLDTFLIQYNNISSVHDEFFKGLEKLKVLDMSNNYVSSLPRSLKLLKVLHTLYLSENQSLCEISILGELTCLEILKLRATGIRNVPEEIGNLTKLRLLDVDYCEHLSFITPGVISKLIWLEEFYIGMKKENCDFVGELSKLKWLEVLHLSVPSLSDFPEDFQFDNLTEFHIKDNVCFFSETRGCKRILEISQRSIPLTKPIKILIEASEILCLWDIKDFDDFLLDVIYGAASNDLRYIELNICENLKSLVKTIDMDGHDGLRTTNEKQYLSPLEEIVLIELHSLQFLWDRPQQHISFCNLTTIIISMCHSLTKLFPLSVAQGLVKLRELFIQGCKPLEAVISSGDEQTTGIPEIESVDNDINLPELSKVCLWDLPKLESFYSGHSKINYPSLKSVEVEYCRSMKTWSNGENYTPDIKFEHEGTEYININDYIKAKFEDCM